MRYWSPHSLTASFCHLLYWLAVIQWDRLVKPTAEALQLITEKRCLYFIMILVTIYYDNKQMRIHHYFYDYIMDQPW